MPRFSSHKRSAARSKLRIRASVPGAGMAVFEVAIVAPEDCCAFRRALPRHRRRADFFLVAERPFSVPFTGMVLCQPVVTSKPHPMARARACHRKFRQDRQTFPVRRRHVHFADSKLPKRSQVRNSEICQTGQINYETQLS